MRKLLLACSCLAVFFFSPQTVHKAFAQHGNEKAFPSDSSLLALVSKYVQTPVKKTVLPNGDVFLQRDMTAYLRAKVVSSPDVPANQKDHGHDHKDDMLRTFLNRAHPNVTTLNKYFEDAAAEFNVPGGLLKATAQVQSNWAQVSESIYGSWGVMGIIENPFMKQITLAASLLHTSVASVQNDAKTNIRAAAALLKHYQNGKPAASVEDWFDAMQSLTGLRDEAMRQSLAVRIYEVLKSGSKSVTLWGEIIFIEPTAITLSKRLTEPDATTSSSFNQRVSAVDYPNAVSNFTTCNFNNRPSGTVPRYYFMHYVATGTYQGAISWFKDCASNVSAHYVIRNSDGQVSQVVQEANRAWSQGVTHYNDAGIGVEHEVLATNLAMWDSDPMLAAAANLCVNVCNRQGIPKSRRVNNGDLGIYGHSDVRSTDCPNMTSARWTAFLNRLNIVTATAPVLYSIANPSNGTQLNASWKANIEPTLAGYRLYYATTDAMTTWNLAADETTLTASTTSVSLNASQFKVPPTSDVYHFKLTAVVADGTNPLIESAPSDIYSRSSNTTGPKVLIVDGFDRTNGSYTASSHPFATSYFKSLRNQASLQISTVADERVADATVVLGNYDIVVWLSGDESASPLVLSVAERTAIKTFLDNGGKFLISGSEIAFNFGRSGTTNYDPTFLNDYLKATYLNDGGSSTSGPFYNAVTGNAGTGFEGLSFPFGIIYPEDYPDAISPVAGAIAALNYNVTPATNKGAVAYKGTFGTGTLTGAVIFTSFTLETARETDMTAFMGKALAYFDVPVITIPTANEDVASTQTGAAKRINVLANDYTNGVAINPASLTIVTPPANGTVTTDAAGSITYVSAAGFTGTDTYQYKVQNTNGQFSNSTTVFITVVAPASCNPLPPQVEDSYPKHDLRGAWVSTVSNIDWPSSRSLSTAQQQAELLKILDTLSATRINTVYLQVRPESDALYQSSIEPWSYWLTGAQGTAPNPIWDPLAFAITEAHKRGMELHAWLNPYRAKQSTPTLASNHVAALHPDWTFVSGSLTMLNPGLPQVRSYVTEVIADIATRYDVDGIHFDDYFYPSAGMSGQDASTYTNNNPTGIATIEDWRRNNVNQLIARVYDTLAFINNNMGRSIRFGVSPFGIWKSGTPAGISGTSSFSAMYCDPIAWLQAGKVDYVAPQLYWKITGAQDYNALSKWWNDQGLTYGRHIYPGLALYKMTDANNWAASEVEAQISLNRDQNHEQVTGQILFSTQQIMANAKGIKTALQANGFRYKSIPAAMSWKDAVCPNAPINVRRDADTLRWDAPTPAADGDGAKRYVVYRFANSGEATTHRNDGKKLFAVVYDTKLGIATADLTNSYFMVTALDKNGNESEAGTGIIVLPVTGLNLMVKLSGNTSTVSWTTITEINTKNFDVERSTDGRSFTKVTTVTAAGNSTGGRTYSAQDFLLTEGMYYYRIKSNDRDGRSNFSAVKSIVYRTGGGMLMGPNPFQSTINISGLLGVKQLDIVDLSGRVLVTKRLNGTVTTTLDLGQLPSGIYHLKATKTNGEFSLVKLVKL